MSWKRSSVVLSCPVFGWYHNPTEKWVLLLGTIREINSSNKNFLDLFVERQLQRMPSTNHCLVSLNHPHTGHSLEGPAWAKCIVFAALRSYFKFKSEHHSKNCRDGSAVKIPGCSHQGPGFKCQPPHGHPQPPVTPVPRNLMPSSDLWEYQAHTWYIYIHASCLIRVSLVVLGHHNQKQLV